MSISHTYSLLVFNLLQLYQILTNQFLKITLKQIIFTTFIKSNYAICSNKQEQNIYESHIL
jgi:hypothetical protein